MKPTIRLVVGMGFLLAVAAGSWCLLESLVTRIPPKAMTVNAMGETSVRIQMYFDQHHELPASLGVLPTRIGYANRTTDGWKHPLIYEQLGSDAFRLTSYGKDSVESGTGDDADIFRNYRVVNAKVTEMQ